MEEQIEITMKDNRKGILNRYIKTGLDNFLEAEVLELMLTFSNRRNVQPIVEMLMERYKTLHAIQNTDFVELLKLPGMNIESVALLKLPRNFSDYLAKRSLKRKKMPNNVKELVDYLQNTAGRLKEENFIGIFLNQNYEIIEIEVLQKGTVNEAMVYPRQVLEKAIIHNATGLILVHNHTSGSPSPSQADKEITRLLLSSAMAMELEIIDHIIICENNHYSFRDTGLLFKLGAS
jgi:DNA repair protein RadC